MRVLHVVSSLAEVTGGPAYTVPALCGRLVDNGVNARIITLNEMGVDRGHGAGLLTEEPKVSVKALSCIESPGLRVIWSPAFSPAMRNEMSVFKPDVVHSHGIWRLENHTAVRIARKSGVPIVISPRGEMTSWAMKQKKVKKRIAWFLYQQRDVLDATVIHATAHNEAEGMRELGFKQPIAIIPNGVALPGDRGKKISRDGPERTVLFMSRIHPKKGLERLIDAWAQIDTAGWKCQIVGPSSDGYVAKLKKRAEASGVGKTIEFRGMVHGDEKWGVYRNADVFILPTNSENFGVVVAEALAAGIPVITTKGAPWKELVEYGCGWWVDIHTDAIAGALRDAMSLNDRQRRAMGERGSRLVAERYAWESIAREMTKVYAWICGKGTKPSCLYS